MWTLLFTASLGGNCFSKLSSNRLEKGGSYSVFFTLNGGIACLFFLISSGFRLQLNGITALFAVVFAGVVLLALYSTMTALQSLPIAHLSIINNTATLLLTSLLGAVLFKEALDWRVALRILLMLIAGFLIFWERKGTEQPKKFPLLPLAGCIAAGLGNYLVLRFYTQLPHKASNSSFFFYTNAILVILAIGYLIVTRQKFRISLRDSLPFTANTLCSNASSLIGILLIARTEAVFYNPVSSALTTLAVLLASILFKEKIGIRSCLAAGLAILAVVL